MQPRARTHAIFSVNFDAFSLEETARSCVVRGGQEVGEGEGDSTPSPRHSPQACMISKTRKDHTEKGEKKIGVSVKSRLVSWSKEDLYPVQRV